MGNGNSTLQANTAMSMRAKFISDSIVRSGKVNAEHIRSEITDAAHELGITYGPISETVYGLLKGNPDAGDELTTAFVDQKLLASS